MRTVLLAFMSTLAAVLMLFGYRTSTPQPVSVATTSVAAAGSTDDGSGSAAAAAPQSTSSTGTTSSSSGTTSTSTPGSATVTGEVVQTRWGPVQVQITVAAGKVTAATAVQQPSENGRDVAINARAVPVLDQEAVDAQSADIDGVSGATYTSDGYVTSLQSALDSAGL